MAQKLKLRKELRLPLLYKSTKLLARKQKNSTHNSYQYFVLKPRSCQNIVYRGGGGGGDSSRYGGFLKYTVNCTGKGISFEVFRSTFCLE